MAITFGPKLGLLFNCNIDEIYYDAFRPFLQALDQLIMGSVINATTVVPPVSPNPGDAYLISSTPSGLWTGFPVNSIAVWDTQVTLSGTNTTSPQWVNYVPNAGWTIWNVATALFQVYNGTSWVTFSGGANFPTNTDITSMTGIPNTTIDTTGYNYNSGTPTFNTVIGATGYQFGTASGSFNSGGKGVYTGNQTWTGTGVTGYAVAVEDSGGFAIMGGGIIGTSGIMSCNTLDALTVAHIQNLRVSTGGMTGDASDQTLTIGGLNMSTVGKPAVLFDPGTTLAGTGVGLIGFSANYYTQTTVGAAGAASALPATPKKYIQIIDTDGSVVVFPVYASA